MDSGFCKLFYVRYVDDFIVGAMGGHNESQTMKNQLEKFLKTKLKMNLSDHKTAIIHFKKSSIFFLGTTIYGISKEKKTMQVVGYSQWQIAARVRVIPRPRLHVPIEVLLKKLRKNGFVRRDSKGIDKPTALRRMVNFDHADIVGYYNSVSRGLLNYYSFVNNYTRFKALIKYHLRSSCVLTIVFRYKMYYKSKAFARFGSKFKCPDSKVEFQISKSFKRTQ